MKFYLVLRIKNIYLNEIFDYIEYYKDEIFSVYLIVIAWKYFGKNLLNF